MAWATNWRMRWRLYFPELLPQSDLSSRPLTTLENFH